MNQDNNELGMELQQEAPKYAQTSPDVVNMMSAVSTADDLDKVVAYAKKFLTVQDTVRKMAIKLTNVHDWVDQNGTPYLQERGCQKIRQAFGMSVKDCSVEVEDHEDDQGKYKIFIASGTGVWQGQETPQIGTCSTRDKFFGKTKAGLKPLSEVSLVDVRKKAMTNLLARVIKSSLGLSFTWDEIAQFSDGKITPTALGAAGNSVAYNKGSRGGNTSAPESKAVKDEKAQVWSMLVEMFGEAGAADALEKATAFTTNDGKDIPGRRDISRVSESQMKFVAPRAKKRYDEWKKEMEANGGQENAFTAGTPMSDDPNA